MSLSGVNDVSEFSDSQVMLKTSMGGLCIKGKNLSINQLNTDTGMLDVKGEIHSIQYVNKMCIRDRFIICSRCFDIALL